MTTDTTTEIILRVARVRAQWVAATHLPPDQASHEACSALPVAAGLLEDLATAYGGWSQFAPRDVGRAIAGRRRNCPEQAPAPEECALLVALRHWEQDCEASVLNAILRGISSGWADRRSPVR